MSNSNGRHLNSEEREHCRYIPALHVPKTAHRKNPDLTLLLPIFFRFKRYKNLKSHSPEPPMPQGRPPSPKRVLPVQTSTCYWKLRLLLLMMVQVFWRSAGTQSGVGPFISAWSPWKTAGRGVIIFPAAHATTQADFSDRRVSPAGG